MIHAFDSFFYGIMQAIQSAILDPIMIGISWLGDNGLIWIVLALVFLIFKKTRKVGLIIALAVVLNTLVVNGLLKHVFDRMRPYDKGDFPWLTKELVESRIINMPHDTSFPSGHTSSSFAAAAALFMCRKKWGIPALIFAALMGLSRMYLYVHYPSDVFVGALVGIICGVIAYIIGKFIFRWMDESGKFPRIRNFITYTK